MFLNMTHKHFCFTYAIFTSETFVPTTTMYPRGFVFQIAYRSIEYRLRPNADDVAEKLSGLGGEKMNCRLSTIGGPGIKC